MSVAVGPVRFTGTRAVTVPVSPSVSDTLLTDQVG